MVTFDTDEVDAFIEKTVDDVMDFLDPKHCSPDEAIDVLRDLQRGLQLWVNVLNNDVDR